MEQKEKEIERMNNATETEYINGLRKSGHALVEIANLMEDEKKLMADLAKNKRLQAELLEKMGHVYQEFRHIIIENL